MRWWSNALGESRSGVGTFNQILKNKGEEDENN